MRASARKHAKTLAEIDDLVRAEHLRVKARASQGGNGTPSKSRKPQGGDPGSGRKGSAAPTTIVVVDGAASAAGPQQKTGVEGSVINVTYVLWGFSQKVQIAGVSGSASCHDVQGLGK